jgi:hypothetical protein
MSPDNQKALFARFPYLFQQRKHGIMNSCMAWGIEVGDGWFSLIEALCVRLEPYTGYVQFGQVKEKYGTLRAYVDYGRGLHENDHDRVEALIREAEHQSSVTCEKCGAWGRLRGRGWYYVACEGCAKKP